ncbi:MAG: hypothetical protein B1H08_04580 [Candidatus Omnitrophica bacterium 4484_171]|nr:MAG: hypothetical protein B1H08_04580 [Candidatus Omnitrophica bacterium 4484_171]RLE05925.1 MAG: hypothetical protein DRJ06_08455 [Candidatus Aminicenantes bacterium]
MLAKKFALGFGIAIIFPMMIHYGVSTFSPKPKWKDYQIKNYYERYKEANPQEKKQLRAEKNKLENRREKAEKSFQKHLFFVAVPLGIIAIVAGAFLSIQAIGTGLMFGGIFSICDGYANYWYALGDPLKFASMLLAFIVLISIGYKKLDNKT